MNATSSTNHVTTKQPNGERTNKRERTRTREKWFCGTAETPYQHHRPSHAAGVSTCPRPVSSAHVVAETYDARRHLPLCSRSRCHEERMGQEKGRSAAPAAPAAHRQPASSSHTQRQRRQAEDNRESGKGSRKAQVVCDCRCLGAKVRSGGAVQVEMLLYYLKMDDAATPCRRNHARSSTPFTAAGRRRREALRPRVTHHECYESRHHQHAAHYTTLFTAATLRVAVNMRRCAMFDQQRPRPPSPRARAMETSCACKMPMPAQAP